MGITFVHDAFCALSIHIDDCSEFVPYRSPEQKAMIKFVIINVLEELSNIYYPAYAVDMNRDEVALLVNLDSQDSVSMSKMKDIATQTKDFIMEKFSTLLTIGIGTPHLNMEGISASYRESMKAQEYKMIKGQGSVIPYSELSGTSQEYIYPVSTEIQFLSSIKVGNTDKVMALLDEVFEQNFARGSISIEMARCLFFDIMSTGLKVLSDVDIDHARVFEEDYQPVSRIISCQTVDEMQNTLKTIYRKICRYVRDNKKSHNEELKEGILDVIHRRYHENTLSLTSVANALNINPSYLSHFFKEQTGENFADYVGKTRVKRAMELLCTTVLPIAAIAEKVGYADSGSLIRAFKKFQGVTPGQYREHNFKNDSVQTADHYR